MQGKFSLFDHWVFLAGNQELLILHLFGLIRRASMSHKNQTHVDILKNRILPLRHFGQLLKISVVFRQFLVRYIFKHDWLNSGHLLEARGRFRNSLSYVIYLDNSPHSSRDIFAFAAQCI